MLFQELELVHANAIAGLQELVPAPASSCTQEAVMSLVPNCGNINDNERLKYGIRLSICEFDSAGVVYPTACDNDAFIHVCANLLEGKSQWWTTLSGNTRAVNAICGEYSRRTYASQMVQAFENVTSVHRQLYRDLHALASVEREMSDKHVAESITKLRSMQDSVDSLQDSIAVLNSAVVSVTDLDFRKIDDDVQAALRSLEEMRRAQDYLFSKSMVDLEAVSNSAITNVESMSTELSEKLLAHSQAIEAATLRHRELSALVDRQIGAQSQSLEMHAELENSLVYLMQMVLEGYNVSRQELEAIRELHSELGSKAETLMSQFSAFEDCINRVMAWVSPNITGLAVIAAGVGAAFYFIGRNGFIVVFATGIVFTVLYQHVWAIAIAIVFAIAFAIPCFYFSAKSSNPSKVQPAVETCLELYF